jgi:hypothetical protein
MKIENMLILTLEQNNSKMAATIEQNNSKMAATIEQNSSFHIKNRSHWCRPGMIFIDTKTQNCP